MKSSVILISFNLLLIASGAVSCNKEPAPDKIQLPVVYTNRITDIKRTMAHGSAYCISTGAGHIDEFGLCWNTTGSPTVNDSCISTDRILPEFTNELHFLTPGTSYYVRAFAVNQAGTGYGNIKKFTTKPAPATIVFNAELTYGSLTDVEGNIYKTIKIGEQTWMAENLRTTRFNDNSPVDFIPGAYDWSLTTKPAFCWFDSNRELFGLHYGAYYNWLAVYSSHLCPVGWHVPTDDEWKTLEINVGMTPENAAKDGWRPLELSGLKEAGMVDWMNDFLPGTNETGFTAVPGGFRYSYGSYAEELESSYWWTASGYYPFGMQGYYRSFSGASAVRRDLAYVNEGYNVRCIKD